MGKVIETDRMPAIDESKSNVACDSSTTVVPDYSKESDRLSSLINFKATDVAIDNLARFGFYFLKPPDDVQCYFCKVVVNNWGKGDDPLYEHFVHADGKCQFLTNVENTNNKQIGNISDLVDDLTRFNNLVRRLKQPKLEMPNEESVAHSSKQNYLPIPRHPDFADFETRLKSFENWPKGLKQTPEELSEAGFFYLGTGDNVKCFSCAGCLKNWQPNDSVLEEHRKHFANRCHFINTFYGHIKRKLSKSNWRPFNKATPEQITFLIGYMDEHPDLRDKKINSLNQKQLYNEMWKDVVEQLNRIEGPKKTIESWKEVWRNLKYNQKRKVSLLKVEKEGVKIENRRETIESDSSQCYTVINVPTTENLITVEAVSESPPQTFTIMEVSTPPQLSPEHLEPSDKVLPKKRKLQKYLFDSENSAITGISELTDNNGTGTAESERKIEKLEYEKLQFEFANDKRQWDLERQQLVLENMSKQLEIEKLKAKIEMMIVKRELENEKEELQKERKQMEMQRGKT